MKSERMSLKVGGTPVNHTHVGKGKDAKATWSRICQIEKYLIANIDEGNIMAEQCLNCHKYFEDYRELALHILSNKKTHRRGLKWAARYMTRQNQLDRKVSLQDRVRTSMDEDDRQNLRDSRRILSGRFKYAKTLCLRCKKIITQQLPVEYTDSPYAWRIQGVLVANCEGCRK